MTIASVGSKEELQRVGKKIVAVGDLEVGVFHLKGEFFAWHNTCPHQGGPVCQGRLFRLVEEVVDADRSSHGRRYHEDKLNIVCPWHGVEYDVRTGRHPGNDHLMLTPARVFEEAGEIYLDV
jgi:nitrite reductase/ring-hydroxylating ferredoxin subunit